MCAHLHTHSIPTPTHPSGPPSTLQGPSFDELLAPYPRIKPWLARVSNACAPHYEEAHAVLRKVRARMLAAKEAEERGGGGSRL